MNIPASQPLRKFVNPFTVPEKIFGDISLMIGQIVILMFNCIRFILRGEIDWPETIRQMYFIGVRSFGVVALTALFTGFAMSLQISRELVLFGADTAIGGVVSLALIREIGPITAGVMVAGRVGSAMAAELTTMGITEQIDALKVMRIDPIQFLAVPRFIACLSMLPVLSVYAMFVGLLAGVQIAHSAANLPVETFLDSVQKMIIDQDFFVHILKSLINATIISMVACAIGLNTRGGAEDVGIATTRATVWCMILIFICNFMVTSLSYIPRPR